MADSLVLGLVLQGGSRSKKGASLRKVAKIGLAMRKPRKISVTIPQSVYEVLRIQSESQGRSLSSLASYWLQLQASHRDGGSIDGFPGDLVRPGG